MIKIKRNYYEIEEWARRSEMVDEAVHYMEQLKFFLEVREEMGIYES